MKREHAIQAEPPLTRGEERIVAGSLPGYRCALLPSGFRFDLPFWKGWRAVGHGAARLVIGLFYIAAGSLIAWAIFANAPAGRSVLWLAGPLLTPAACVLLGLWIGSHGACLLFGRRRIEADARKLRASWRLGPLTLFPAERDFVRLRRLVVLASNSLSGTNYPELVAGLEGNKAFVLAAGFSRELLLAMAHRLAQISPDSTDLAPIPVIEETRDHTDVRTHQPVRSRVGFVADADGLTFTLRPLSSWEEWLLYLLRFPLGVFIFLAFSAGLVTMLIMANPLKYWSGDPTPLFLMPLAICCFVGLYLFIALREKGRLGNWERLTLSLDNERLLIRREWPQGSKMDRWEREVVSDVTTFMETTRLPPSEGRTEARCLQGLQLIVCGNPPWKCGAPLCDVTAADWEWIATTLRNALAQDRASAASPSGFTPIR